MEHKKILFVDKIKAIIEREKSALSRIGCTVIEAESGEEALDIIYEERPDLVVLDYIMPNMSGIQICEKVKQDPRLKEIKVIIICMLGRANDVKTSLAAGCDDTLLKPFSRSDLLGKIQKHLAISTREHVRVPLETDTRMSVESTEKTKNISEDGVFIVTKKPLKPGTMIKMKFSLPGTGNNIQTRAEVMWIRKGKEKKGPDGMGVKFVNLSSEMKEIICSYKKSKAI